MRTLVSALPADFPNPILIVMHIGARESLLPWLLNENGKLRATHAEDGDRIEPGRIYIAPPDHHLLVVDGKLELDHGPRENYARPAVDPLFRSAARAYGEDVIGIILTGEMNDGTAGLYEVKKAGGTTIVQRPSDAEWPAMPRSAISNVATDYCLPLPEIAGVLVRLAKEPKGYREEHGVSAMANHEHDHFQRPVGQTCPECGGAMREQAVGKLTQYRCHIGHVMSAEVLATAQREALEKSFSTALRTLNERRELCADMAKKCDLVGDPNSKEQWVAAGEEAKSRIALVRELVESEWAHPETC